MTLADQNNCRLMAPRNNAGRRQCSWQMSENMLAQVDATVKTGVSADTIKGEAASYATLYWFSLKAKSK